MEPTTIAVLVVGGLIVAFIVWKKMNRGGGGGSGGSGRGGPGERRN